MRHSRPDKATQVSLLQDISEPLLYQCTRTNGLYEREAWWSGQLRYAEFLIHGQGMLFTSISLTYCSMEHTLANTGLSITYGISSDKHYAP